MALVPLHQETQELSLPCLSLSISLSLSVTEKKMVIWKAGSVSSLNMGFAGTLILDFLLSRTVSSLLFKPLGLCE